MASMRSLVALLFLTAALAIRHETTPPTEVAPPDAQRVAQDAANLEVLKKLFGKLDIEDEEDASSQIHYDEEDDAFLGVVSKLLQAIEESEDGSVAKETLVQAARNEEFPHFEEFVGSLVTEADEDGDEALNAKEKEEFVEGLRMHVAHEVFGRDDGETDAAVGKILEILAEGAGGGVTKQSLVEAAETHFHPELSELVAEIFEDADENADGVLDKDEVKAFTSLFEEVLMGSGSSGDEESDEDEDEEGDGDEETDAADPAKQAEAEGEADEATAE
mmetsp:Transcript_11854/g.33823  ORF Transcript_11854/g.33823 Transcript_11854/m.33823 type:complete len:276 (-) Transcript_11854:220-1047(-)